MVDEWKIVVTSPKSLRITSRSGIVSSYTALFMRLQRWQCFQKVRTRHPTWCNFMRAILCHCKTFSTNYYQFQIIFSFSLSVNTSVFMVNICSGTMTSLPTFDSPWKHLSKNVLKYLILCSYVRLNAHVWEVMTVVLFCSEAQLVRMRRWRRSTDGPNILNFI